MQNPDSKVANTLVGLFHLRDSARFHPSDPAFTARYRRALTEYVERAYRLDPDAPLACAALGAYFLPRQDWAAVERLGRRAVRNTDVNALASDAWYLLARAAHYAPRPDWARVQECYGKADAARGGGETGFAPAKLGIAQAQARAGDRAGARFRLEGFVRKTNSFEARVLLGVLCAQEAFEPLTQGGTKDEKKELMRKAAAHLDNARLAWKDVRKNLKPDVNVLLALARLYETDHPDKALSCLLEVQDLSLNDLQSDLQYADVEDEALRKQKKRAHLPPQLLNNIACFQFQLERFGESTETFQLALNSCMNLKEDEGPTAEEADRLVSSISYNLARSYEGAGELDEAMKVYETLLARHADYTDAKTRLVLIALRQHPTDQGPAAMSKLYNADNQQLEVRALYAWYLSRQAKRQPLNLAEDHEQRVHKHTLQYHEKHDAYALTGLGNLHLLVAREMRRATPQELEKRRRTYDKALEFFAKALALDPRNAYAAQGVAIAQAEDQRNFAAAVHTLTKVKDAVRDSATLVNLGHAYGELRQYGRAMEMYEAAVARDRARDPQVVGALGRAAYLKGRAEKAPGIMKAALAHAQRALELAPNQPHLQFNVAFVQMQLAQLLHGLPADKRTAADLEAASRGLDAAIDACGALARAPHAPFPRADLEQRAAMGKNTMRKQIERDLATQREYEAANASKVAAARAAREQEAKARLAAEAAEVHKREENARRIQEERAQMMESSRRLAEERAAELRAREAADFTEDETGERVRRKKKARGTGGGGGKRKKKSEDIVDDDDEEALAPVDASDSGTGSGARATGEGEAPRKKKRKLARRGEGGGKPSKFKSAEVVVDSDEDDVAIGGGGAGGGRDPFALSDNELGLGSTQDANGAVESDTEMKDADGDVDVGAGVDDEEEEEAAPVRRGKTKRAIDDDEEDEGEASG